MLEKKPLKEKDSKRHLTDLGKFSTIGITLLAIILISALLGYWIDRKFSHSTPWATATSSLLGIAIGLLYVFNQIKD
jgi:F0F1-type ATP synthase assembly protein I